MPAMLAALLALAGASYLAAAEEKSAPGGRAFPLSCGICRLFTGLGTGQGGAVKKKTADYNPDIELAKGAALTASSYDKTQGVDVTLPKVTVGGRAGEVEFTGEATGKGPGIEGTMNVWLSIFRFTRPDGTVNHVSGWNIALALKPGQTALETAKAFEQYINTNTRPYRAAAHGDADKAALKIVYKEVK